MGIIKNYFPSKISKKQATDSGMALVLIFLLMGFFLDDTIYYIIAIPILVVNMIIPGFFYPFAVFWLGISQLLGTVVSKVILTIIYILIVIPVALIRKAGGRDSLQLSKFKKGSGSVMFSRDHTFTSNDIIKPY